MSYNSSSLSAISYANGFTLWHYRKDDSREYIASAGYFNAASNMLREGDFMLINAWDGDMTLSVDTNRNGDVLVALHSHATTLRGLKP